MKKMIFIVMLFLGIGCFVGCGTTKIEINSYVSVEFEGYDTLGSISQYEFKTKEFLNDYEKPLEDVSKKEIEKLLANSFTFKDSEELKNGDNITVKWDIDEEELLEFEEEYGVKLIFSDFEIKVRGLEEVEIFDPFEKISIQYEGVAPYISAKVDKTAAHGTVGYGDYYYILDKKDNLSNGDIITVEITLLSYADNDIKKYCYEKYGKVPSTVTKEFIVSGCPEIANNFEDISSEDIKKIDEYIKGYFKEKTENWVYPESFCKMTFMGNIFASLKDGATNSTGMNTLYFIYKIDVDNVKDGVFSFYYCGNISALILDKNGDAVFLDENGELTSDINNIINLSMSEITSSGLFYTEGIYFTYGDLNYDGYLTYDDFYVNEIEPLLESYNITDNVDKEIITQVTHEPRDYSAITATLKLEADCFTYKWYQGSYYVAGLSDKGYQELLKYSASDYISLQLPATTTDGSVVEGMYSSKAEGGYSFSMLMNSEMPRLELVCADNYTDFYGFCDDNSFDENYGYKLKRVVLNDAITEISAYAFIYCTGLESVVLPANLETVGDYAFYNCSKLVVDSLEIGNLTVGVDAFEGVTFNTVTISADNFVQERYISWGDLYTAFNGAVIRNINISEGVTKIPDYAFEGSSGYVEVVLPSSVKEIGKRAFADNTELKTITLSNAEVIGEEAFEGCTGLVIDKFYFGGISIGVSAFSGATINEIILSSDNFVSSRYTKYSMIYTQWKGATVQKITISEGVTTIPNYAFEYCEGITEIVLPSTVKTIGTGAFSGSTTLAKVTLNEGLEVIGVEAFKYCTNLKIVNIPSTVNKIDTDAFHSCQFLLVDKLDISGMTINTYAFYQATIKELVLDSNECTSLRFVDWGTLYAPWTGSYVKQIVITENVTEIPSYAFEAIALVEEITIPASVTKIGDSAFRDCSALKRITIPASVTEFGSEVFLNDAELTIIAPKGSAAEKYATDNGIKFAEKN